MGNNPAKEHQILEQAFANTAQRKQFFFEPASRLQLVEKLEHLNRFSDFMLLVTGPEGAGKTTLLERLRAVESDRSLRVCFVDAAVSGDLTSLLKSIAQQLTPQIDTESDNQQLLNGIYEFAQVMAADHIQWVIIIDNGEQLDSGSGKLLLQMISDDQGLPLRPHLLLAGQDELITRLQSQDEFAPLEHQVHRLPLEPFSESESGEYLKRRYGVAESLSEAQLQAIYKASGGYPGTLNQQAERMFNSGSVKKVSANTGMPKQIVTMVAAVMLLVLGVALWQFWPETTAIDSDRTQVQLDLPIGADAIKPASTTEVVAEVVVEQPEPVVEQVRPQINKPLVVEPVTGPQVAIQDEPTVVVSEEPVAPVVAEKPVKTVAGPVVAELAKPEPEAVQQAVAKPAVSNTPDTSSAQELSDAEKQLLSWPSTSYTLQMLGASMRESAEKFVSAQSEPQKFYLFRTTYKGKPWFVVVYGQYKDRKTASEAAKKLPGKLVKLQPWARSIQGIQADIKARK